MPINMNMLVFLPGTAAKCCELKRCADRVRSRTDNKDEVLEGKFSNLNFSHSTEKTTEYSFKLFLSIYRYLIFSKVLNYTSVELNRFAKQAKLLYIYKKLFFKSDGQVMRFPDKEKRRVPKRTAQFPAKKDGILHPPSGSLGTPLPLSQSLCGRVDGRTLTSQPKFLGNIGYQIWLSMVLCWRACERGLRYNASKVRNDKINHHVLNSITNSVCSK